MRPLKLRLVAEMPTSPFSRRPVPRPMQGPQLGGRGMAPASSRECHNPRFPPARPRKLDGSVECFVVLVQAAESDDDVFAADAFRQFAFENDLNGARNLPPELSGDPDRSGVGTDNGRADGA